MKCFKLCAILSLSLGMVVFVRYQTIDSMACKPDEDNKRVAAFHSMSRQLQSLSDNDLAKLIEQAPKSHAGIGGTSVKLDINGKPVFVKQIPLTDLERRPENYESTANVFRLPMYYQYGVGSAGFGAWRELLVHTVTTNWVLTGECPNFPLMSAWRILPTTPQPHDEETLRELDQRVNYWGGSSAIRSRLEAIHNAATAITIFLEYIPHTLDQWLTEQVALGDEAVGKALAMVEHDLKTTTAFMQRKGMLHFDAHFRNILTDGKRLYFADFGLALMSQFKLSSEEHEFLCKHQNYDRFYVMSKLANAIITTGFGKEGLHKRLQQYASGQIPPADTKKLTPAMESIVIRYAPIAVVMNTFFKNLREDTTKQTPYPADELKKLQYLL